MKELEFRINLAEKQLEASQKIQERTDIANATESRFVRSQAATEKRFQESQKAAESRFNIKLHQDKGLTNSTRTMLEAAPQVSRFVDKIQNQINDANAGLGPIGSRWKEFKAGKIGFTDPAFTKLRTDVGLLTTLLMRMHVGARGGEYIMKHFQDMFAYGKQSPQNLSAALDEVKSYANDLMNERSQGINFSNQGQQETRVLNGQTYIKVQGGWQLKK